MCGIIGYVGKDAAVPILIEGLKKLEYRGYDSSGVAVLQGGKFEVRRAVGKLQNLETLLRGESLTGAIGVGHVRWATHGRPSEENAHPHRAGSVVVVHNGIIENHEAIRARLMDQKFSFASDTDTEVIAHLIAAYRRSNSDLLTATWKAAAELQGAFAIAVVSTDDPDAVVLARKGAPLLLGLGEGENFAASDVSALVQVTRRIVYLEHGDCAEIRPDGVRILDASGEVVRRAAREAGDAAVDAATDTRITAEVKRKLLADPNLSSLDISVNTTDGRVTLSGKVASADLVGRAMLLAMETDGVREVVSTLQVPGAAAPANSERISTQSSSMLQAQYSFATRFIPSLSGVMSAMSAAR